MKQTKTWPPYIEETLDLLDTLWQPEQLPKESQPVARYLKQHNDPLLHARYQMALYPHFILERQEEKLKSVLQGIERSELTHRDSHLNGLYNFNASKYNYMHRNADAALKHIESALTVFRKNGNKKWIALSLFQLYITCVTFNISSKYEPVELLWEIVSICDETGFVDEVMIHLYSSSCSGIGSFYILEEKNNDALEFLEQPFFKLNAIGSPHVLNIRFLKATAMVFERKFEEALQIFTELYNSEHLKYTDLTQLHLGQYIASCALSLNVLPDYIDYYNQYINAAKKSELTYNVLGALCIEAQKEASEKNRAAALSALESAQTYLTQHNMTAPFHRLYFEAESKVHELLGDYQAGWEAYKNSQKYFLKNQSSVTDKKIEVLKNRVKIATQEKENETLKMELALQARELELTATFLQRKNDLVDDILAFTNSVSKKHKNQTGFFEIKKKLISIKAEDTERDKLKELLDKNNQAYIKKITGQYPSITNAEAKICALIKIGLGNKEIASLLVTSLRTVDTHRSNIRRKLKLATTDNLEKVLREM